MNKSGPGFGQIFVMVAFALSCFGLLLYLWIAFGGPVPLRPKPYEVSALFKQGGGQLATYTDVRISGVTVGKVVTVKRENDGAITTMKIDPKYAPLPADTKATLRTKTLVGEAFVALSFGDRRGPTIKDQGTIPPSQVEQTSQLDEIFNVLNKPTRAALRDFILTTDKATRGSGANLNDGLGELQPALESGSDLFTTLNRQRAAVQSGVRNLGTVFSAIGRQQAAVRELTASGGSLLQSTSAVTQPLQETLRILPTFLNETKATLRTARVLTTDANPALEVLRPVTPLIKPALQDIEGLAPDLRTTLTRLNPIISRSGPGLRALNRTVNAARPAFDAASPLASQLLPIAQYIDAYRNDFNVAARNTPAAINQMIATPNGPPRYSVRLLVPVLDATELTVAKQPYNTSRLNPYPLPGNLNTPMQPSLSCDNTKNAVTGAEAALNPSGNYPCTVQRQLDTNGVLSQFPKLLAADPSQQSQLNSRNAIK